jgi:hypothetical protein
MKTPLDTRGSRANDGRSARLGKKQPDGTHGHRIAHLPRPSDGWARGRAECRADRRGGGGAGARREGRAPGHRDRGEARRGDMSWGVD